MRARGWFVATVVFGLLGVHDPAAARQQTPPAAPPPTSPAAAAPEPTPQEIVEAKTAELAAELAAARRALESATEAGAVPPVLRSEVELLQRIELLLSQQRAALQQQAELAGTEADLTAQLETTRRTGPDPSLTFLDLEALRDQLASEEQRRERIDDGVGAARAAFEQAKRTLDEKERARRSAREASETNTDEAKTQELATQLRLAQIESRSAAELVAVRDAELRREELNQAVYRLGVSLLQERINRARDRVRLTATEHRQALFDLSTRDQELQQRIDLAQRNQEYLDAQLFDARRRLETAGDPGDAQREEVEYRKLAQRAGLDQTSALNKQREHIDDLVTAWNRRFDLAIEAAERQQVDTWLDECRDKVTDLERAARFDRDDLAAAQTDLAAIQPRIDAASAEAKRWISARKPLLEARVALHQDTLTTIERAARVHRRLLDEIEATANRFSLGDQLARVRDRVVAVWQYPFYSVDDKPITVGKVVIGLILVALGFAASRVLSTLLGRRLLRRMGMPEGGAAAIQALIFYLLLGLFILLALRAVRVPLTAFTILGGALAIGVGFGSQTIIRNFFSGLILLAERPIRVGDLIQVGDLFGTVERVGARSTRIRTGDNIEIVAPNSTFLEQNVINWTLSETRVRVHVSVGVVYGSPTREVTKLLMKAVQEHGRVLKSPPPIVLFKDFGDNALIFEIHFWIQMRSVMDRRTLESDVRYRIDSLFREAGVVIAFPQRDVHLDSLRPVEVRVVGAEKPAEPALSRADGQTDDTQR